MRKIKQNSIIFVILYGLIFYSINFILSINNIVFMNWIYYFSNGIIILGSIIGIYQLILKIKNKIKKNVFIIIMTIFSSIVICIYIYISLISYNPEYIKEFLESPIGEYLIDSRKTGTAVAMINVKDLKEIPIVEMSLEDQNKIIDEYIEKEKKLKKEMEELQHKLENIKFDLYDKMTIKDTFNII